MSGLVQNTVHDFSLGVLHDSRACLSNAAGQGVHLNDESRDDDSNAFTVLSSVSVEREAGASAAKQFDAGNSVDINIGAGNRLDRVSRQFQMTHDSPRCLNGVNVPNFGTVEKNAALSFYRLNKIWRAFYRNLKGSTSTSSPNSIRGGARPLNTALIREESIVPPVLSIYSVLLPEKQPFAMSGQLSSANAGAFYSRALSRCVDFQEPHPSKTTHRLPVIVAVACCPLRHVFKHDRGSFRNVGQVFRGENRV